jgi:hypothetical protein
MLKKIVVTLVLASAVGGVTKLIVHHKLTQLETL